MQKLKDLDYVSSLFFDFTYGVILIIVNFLSLHDICS